MVFMLRNAEKGTNSSGRSGARRHARRNFDNKNAGFFYLGKIVRLYRGEFHEAQAFLS